MKNNIIHVDFKKIEQAEDHNCEAIAWGQNEHHKLHAIKSKLCRIDMMDGILGNEPTLLDCIRSVEEAIQINTRQTNHDKSEQEIFNEFMPFDAA